MKKKTTSNQILAYIASFPKWLTKFEYDITNDEYVLKRGYKFIGITNGSVIETVQHIAFLPNSKLVLLTKVDMSYKAYVAEDNPDEPIADIIVIANGESIELPLIPIDLNVVSLIGLP
jgi:hypothetical protein